MDEERIVLCGANSYEQKYYFNETFKALPEHIKRSFRFSACCLRRTWAES